MASRQARGRPGRPADLYHSTELGESLFAGATTGDFSVELLSLIEDEDPELVARVFDRRRRRRVEQCWDKLAGKSLGETVAGLAAVLDTEGYMAQVDTVPEDGYRLTLHSCPIWAVASHYGQACTTELEFMRELIPDADVTRIIHKVAGAYVCAYEIREAAAPAGSARARAVPPAR